MNIFSIKVGLVEHYGVAFIIVAAPSTDAADALRVLGEWEDSWQIDIRHIYSGDVAHVGTALLGQAEGVVLSHIMIE